MLKAINPMIMSATRHHLRKSSPVALGKARLMTLGALQRYDSQRSTPQTFISQQLQGLQRWDAARTNGLRVPVRASGQSLQIDRITEELKDSLGREPSTSEIASKASTTSSAIENIRKFSRPTPGSTLSPSADGEPTVAEDQMLKPKDDQAWLEMVYDDLPDRDKVVMEYTLGMFGRKKLNTRDLANKLGVSQGAVSQRRKKVQSYVDRALEVNPL